MSRRTYRQYCGLAAALDVVGQRWALLIVRDLVPGPRRFTDLFDGLPGISTDLLTERLRSLEAAGAVQQCEIRNPVPANLYELTDRGRELAKLASGLARWGANLLPNMDEAGDRIISARLVLQYRSAGYRGGFADGDVHITIDNKEDLTLSMSGPGAKLTYGHSDNEPLLRIVSTTEAILHLLRTPPDQLGPIPPGFTSDGDDKTVTSLFRSLTAYETARSEPPPHPL